MREKLKKQFENKSWAGKRGRMPRSGHGSTLETTAPLRQALPGLFSKYNVKTFLDAPCGDCLFHLRFWLRWAFFENFVASGIPYLLTTRNHVSENKNVASNAGFRQFNPCQAPFNFPEPLETVWEMGQPHDDDVTAPETSRNRKRRSIDLWSRDQVVDVLSRRAA